MYLFIVKQEPLEVFEMYFPEVHVVFGPQRHGQVRTLLCCYVENDLSSVRLVVRESWHVHITMQLLEHVTWQPRLLTGGSEIIFYRLYKDKKTRFLENLTFKRKHQVIMADFSGLCLYKKVEYRMWPKLWLGAVT